MSALAAYRWHIWSYGTDTGTFAQVALHAFSGFRDGPEDTTHFAFHWAPLLAVLYPFVATTRSPLSIQIVQAVAIGAGVFPFFAFLRRYADDDLASRLALLALVYPPLAAVAFDEFHEIAFYPLLAFALVWALDAERPLIAAACAALAVLVREEVPIVLGVFGLALIVAGLVRRGTPGRGLLVWEPRAPRAAIAAGIGLCVLSAATLYAYFGVVIRALGGWRPAHFYDYPFAHGPVALIAAAFVHPLLVAGAVVTLGRFTYLLEALVPLLFLPLRSAWFVVALPGLLIVLLSSDAITWRMGSHYAASWIPWVLLGTAAAVVRLARTRSEAAAKRTLTVVFTLCAIVFVAFNPMHVVHYMVPPYRDLADARRALALVPAGASVITHDEWFVHVAVRDPRATVFWRGAGPQYAVFADDYPNDSFQRELLPRIRAAVAAGRYRVVARFGAVVVYERIATRGGSG